MLLLGRHFPTEHAHEAALQARHVFQRVFHGLERHFAKVGWLQRHRLGAMAIVEQTIDADDLSRQAEADHLVATVRIDHRPHRHAPGCDADDGRSTMLDWLAYRKELTGRIGEIGKLSPGTTQGYAMLSGAGAKTNHLDAKTRELIALAVAVTTHCDGCITVHTGEA
ncbi:hypothetical protein KCV01_g16437, partial [Aureobasidium melanogenum]